MPYAEDARDAREDLVQRECSRLRLCGLKRLVVGDETAGVDGTGSD
jgi:hypothetical protein